MVFGYLLARIVISVIFLPQYFKGQMFTAYELMQRRFGTRVRKVTAAIFLVTRSLAEGVRVFAISIVVSIILHTSGLASILVIIALTLFYTFEGGMTAVIWTDVIQMGMYVVGAAVSFFVLLGKIPGGFGHVIEVAGPAGKFQVFDFHWSWTNPYTFWAGCDRRLFPDDREPWHGSTGGAAAAEREIGAREPPGAVRQLGRDFRAVHAVPDDRRPAVGLSRMAGRSGKMSSTGSIRRSSGIRCRWESRGWRWRPSSPRRWRIFRRR